MIPAMPETIAGGVNNVCLNVKKSIKDHLNKHGGYKYVSYDTFLEDIGPLMAEAGLFLVMNEAHSESDGKWLTLTFHIYLYHKSGAAFGPVVRSQGVMANGPQAYAAAQSFAEKYFIRQLFKVPTGEEDTDADSQGKAQIPASKKPSKDFTAERDLAIGALQMCADAEALDSWAVDNKDQIHRLPPAEQKAVREAFAAHKKTLQQKEAA